MLPMCGAVSACTAHRDATAAQAHAALTSWPSLFPGCTDVILEPIRWPRVSELGLVIVQRVGGGKALVVAHGLGDRRSKCHPSGEGD